MLSMRQLLLFFFSHRLLVLARWDLHFMRLRLRNFLTRKHCRPQPPARPSTPIFASVTTITFFTIGPPCSGCCSARASPRSCEAAIKLVNSAKRSFWTPHHTNVRAFMSKRVLLLRKASLALNPVLKLAGLEFREIEPDATRSS